MTIDAAPIPRDDDPARQWLRDAYLTPAADRAIDFEGARIAYRYWNEADAHLPGLVLVHGFRAHARWWDHIAPLLTATHRVAALDLSGMGDSDRRDRYSRLQHGREPLAVADALGFADPTIIAHSYGALSSLIAARAEPERYGHLIAIDVAVPLPEDTGKAIKVRPRRYYPSRAAAMERFALIPPGRWPDPDVKAYVGWHSMVETPDGWTWKFDPDQADSLNAQADYQKEMFGVRARCDFVFGEQSELAVPERIRHIPNVAPGAPPITWIPASHHHVMIEQPLALISALRVLLANNRRDRP